MILAAVRDGLTNQDAALVAGVTDDTLRNWQTRYSEFSAQLAQAHAERAQGWLAGIAAAAPKDWRALESLLDRCAPAYRKKTEVEVAGRDGGPILFDPGWVALRTAILAALADQPDVAAELTAVIAMLGDGSG